MAKNSRAHTPPSPKLHFLRLLFIKCFVVLCWKLNIKLNWTKERTNDDNEANAHRSSSVNRIIIFANVIIFDRRIHISFIEFRVHFFFLRRKVRRKYIPFEILGANRRQRETIHSYWSARHINSYVSAVSHYHFLASQLYLDVQGAVNVGIIINGISTRLSVSLRASSLGLFHLNAKEIHRRLLIKRMLVCKKIAQSWWARVNDKHNIKFVMNERQGK